MFGPRIPGNKATPSLGSKYAHDKAPPGLTNKGHIDHSGTKDWQTQDFAR